MKISLFSVPRLCHAFLLEMAFLGAIWQYSPIVGLVGFWPFIPLFASFSGLF
jgi:hypothetical protein